MGGFVSLGFAALLALVLRQLYRMLRGSSRTPPGPRSLPFIGNVHQLPMEFHERKFFEWGRQYGGIVYAMLFQTPVIIVNSAEVAHDLMDKRSANYSDRPEFPLLDLMGWTNALTQLRYGEQFRKHRKWIQDAFQSKAALKSFQPLQRRETSILLSSLVGSPEAFADHFRRLAAAIIMEVTYGHRVNSLEDEYIGHAERAGVATVRTGSPGSGILSLLVGFFPILKHYPMWLPGSGFKVKTNEIRKLVELMMNTPYNMVKERLTAGTAAPSLTGTLLEEHYARGGMTAQAEDEIRRLSGTIYAAGTDTTVTGLRTFILAMVRNPEVFKKAQQEIDKVVGSDRLPEFEDREALSYLDCILKEVYRWGAPVPLAIPHRSMVDDDYQGYLIPGDTMIIPNIWGMTRNETAYPDPEVFRPERFMGLTGTEADDIDPRRIIFGFGRRQCPGQQLADATIFLAAAHIIATMDISKCKDQSGNEITPAADFHSGFVVHPKDFACVIRPRSQKIVTMIEQDTSSI